MLKSANRGKGACQQQPGQGFHGICQAGLPDEGY
ncbi:Uncharacterised protein [Yersinia intermedia]|nr:Uncharacterised protein [Yersinia intermedia]CNI04966.1 Uncharacterised protein [Yersinia intermedia]CNJ84975.1 Uncharacterised protein [Yersinia intermedia]CQD83212.1 Uncharacterised protein [Yersinia intermedia]